jgi:hypothetical protein
MCGLKTKVINRTNVPIELIQGSGNVYTVQLCTLQRDCAHDIHFDSETTAIDYWCALEAIAEGHPRVIITSDNCAEYKEVEIVEEPANSKQYTWKGTKTRSKSRWGWLTGALKLKVTFRFRL